MISKTFVGRGDELEKIQEWLQKPAGLILITGAGGIGKTSLLRKITEKYSADERFVVDYFDLAEQPMTMINQAVHLANSLGQGHFPEFMKKLTELDTASSTSAIGGLEDEAVNTCVKEAIAYLESRKKKLLRITDTFEIAMRYSHYDDNWLGGINEKLKDALGPIFVIAGRDKLGDENILEKIYPLLEESFGNEIILHLPLSGFDEIETDDFFTKYDEHHMIPQDMREKLQLLTDGRPILLSLAVEWLQKEIPLPDMIENSLTELREIATSKSEWNDLLNKFEFELVREVRNLQNPINIASLYMAQIDRRMDSRLLSALLDIDDARAEEYLLELMKFPFVKEYVGSTPRKCTLHDEMRELVRKHAWGTLDISGDERRSLTQVAIEHYYIPRIEVLKQKKHNLLSGSHTTLLQDAEARVEDQERWLLEAETLYYYSKLSEKEAFAFFDQTFYDREDSYIRDQFLLDELKRAELNKDKVAVRDADGLRRRGRFNDVERICMAVITQDGLDVVDRLHAYTTLGSMQEETKPIVAEKSYVEALDLAISIKDFNIQRILHNNLGRLYRNMSRLDDSIEHFNKALTLSRHTGNPVLISTIRNNLAWTYRLNGDLDRADVLCQLSIAENLQSGKERPLAYSYLTKADIDRDKGDLQSAEQYVRQALDMFSRQDDEDGIAQAYRTLANISRQLYRFDQALEYLEKGIQLTSSNEALPLLASMYQLYGRTIRHYANYLAGESKNGGKDVVSTKRNISFSQALDALAKSIEISHMIGNRWESARSLIEVVLIKMLESEAYDVSELHMLLDQVWDTASDLEDNLLMGYVWENRARIDQHKGKYTSAGHSFGEAAYHIAKRTGAESARAFTRFHNILLARELNEKQRHALAKGMREKIREQDYTQNSKLAALISLCEQILDLSGNEE